MSAFDKTDRIILQTIQQNASVSTADLAETTGASIATVQRRLVRLRESGVILREICVLDRRKVGQPMTFVVMVELERERADQIDAFARRCQGEPQVQQCYYVTGEADFSLICSASDMDDFEALTRRLLFDEPNVRKFRTSVVMGVRKASLALPIDDH